MECLDDAWGMQLLVAVLLAGVERMVSVEVPRGPVVIAAGQADGGGVCGLPTHIPAGFCSW